MELSQLVWLVLIVVLGVAEVATATLVSVWFCVGGVAALLVALFFPGALLVQGVVFLVVSALALLALRPLARRLIGGKMVPTNADANIGKHAQVVVEIQPDRFGRVRLEALEWTAKSSQLVPVGSWVEVMDIEGAKLVVRPLEKDGQDSQKEAENV